MIDLQHLRTLCDAATPGPWSRVGLFVLDDQGWWLDTRGDNTAFIAASRTALPELLDEIERLRQSLGNLLAIIHRDGGHYTAMHGHEKAVRDAHLIWASLIGENERLRTALKPFASVPPALLNMPELENDDPLVEPWFSTDLDITVGDLRRAREALGERANDHDHTQPHPRTLPQRQNVDQAA